MENTRCHVIIAPVCGFRHLANFSVIPCIQNYIIGMVVLWLCMWFVKDSFMTIGNVGHNKQYAAFFLYLI